MMRRKVALYLAGAVMPVAASLFSSAALAQTSPSATDATKQPGDNPGQIGDIVVTAQRREQKLQDVPISVSALTSQAAQALGVTGTASLQTTVPSLSIVRLGLGASPFLRGVGSSNADANSESSVAVYLDGVYQPTATANFFDLPDIERVEVLKGPQGTLFGRNSTGGVIQVITKDPAPDLQAKFSVGYANYKTVTTDAYLSVPVTKDIAFNTSVYYQNRNDGWGRNIFLNEQTPGANSFAVRSKLKITPDEDTTIIFAGNYSKNRDGGLNGQAPDALSNSTTVSAFPGRYNTNSNKTDANHTKSYGGSLHIDRDFGAVRIASITSYEKTNTRWDLDFDATPLQLVDATEFNYSKTFTQEVHFLSATDSKLQWLIGGFYYYRNAGVGPAQLRGLAFAPLPGVDLYGSSISRSRSLFAQATYPVLLNTNLTAGFRYSWESSTGMGSTNLPGTSIIVDTANGLPATGHISYSRPTWRLSLDHKFSPDILGYISYNRGIKSGGFGLSAGAAGIAQPFLTEKIDAYEAGLKTELFDRHLRVNVAGFYYNFKNIQFQRLVAGSGFIFNGPSAKIYGGEIEIEARPTRSLTLTANLGLTHSRFGDFPNAPNSCIAPGGASDNGGVCAPGTFAQLPGPPLPYNAQGTELPFASPVTGNAGFIYDYPTASGNFSLASNVYYYGGAAASIGDRLHFLKYTLVSASLGWTSSNKVLSVKVWGKNLTDKYYYSQISVAPGLSDLVAPAEPRTFGATLTYNFN